jgi:hypothetical protein
MCRFWLPTTTDARGQLLSGAMLSFSPIVRLLVLLLLFASPAFAITPAEPTTTKVIAGRHDVKGRLTQSFIEFPEQGKTSAYPIKFTIENISNRVLSFSKTPRYPLCNISLIDDQGEPCRLTVEGKKYYGPAGPNAAVVSGRVVWLEPGKAAAAEVDLATHFSLRPGRWRLRLSVPVGETRHANGPAPLRELVDFGSLELIINK